MSNAVRVQKIESWPNKLGFECTVNNAKFSVMNDRVCGKLSAVRVVKDKIVAHIDIVNGNGEWIDGDNRVAELVFRMWRDSRKNWNLYE